MHMIMSLFLPRVVIPDYHMTTHMIFLLFQSDGT
jgi:hypothetical protein